jgi:hypothetical protein
MAHIGNMKFIAQGISWLHRREGTAPSILNVDTKWESVN